MPTYKNTTNADVALGNERIPKGESYETQVFYPTLPAGIVKTSDLPSYNPIVLSTSKSGNLNDLETLSIPATVNGEQIAGLKGTIYCAAGSVEVRFNSASVEPAIILGTGFTYNIGYRMRLIDVIHFKFTAASSQVIVNLEKNY